MGDEGDIYFRVDMGDGRVAKWRLERDGAGEPYTLFLRPDEALAIVWLLSGALRSHEIFRMNQEESDGGKDAG